MALQRDEKGNLIMDALGRARSTAFNVGQNVASYVEPELGERGFRTDAFEAGKGMLKGAIRGTKDVLELPLDAARYAPYAALPAEALFKAGAATVAGFQDEKDEDVDYGLDTLMNTYKQRVDNWQEYSGLGDIQDSLDEAFKPLFQKLSKEYDSPVYDTAEVFGEFLTTIPAVKALVAGGRAIQIASLKPLIQKSKDALTKELGKKASDEIVDSPRDRYQYITENLGQEITDGARKEVRFLETNKRKILKLQQKNKELLSLKRSIGSDVAAAGAGAFAITYVESQAPEQAHWLAPLAGISAAVLAPPILINNSRSISFNMLGMLMKGLGREDDALDMFIRGRGMNPNDLLDEKGRAIVSPKALKKKKQMLLASTPQELKFYERVAQEIEQLPDEQKNTIYQSAITYKELFEKFQNKAEAKGLGDVSDSFVPLVHNVIQMAGVRSLQQALLKRADAGFFLTPKKLFQNQLSSEIDYLLTAQEVQIDFVRSELAGLAKVAEGDADLAKVVGDMQDMVTETNEMFSAVSKQAGVEGKNLKRNLAYNTVGFQDQDTLQKAGVHAKELVNKYGTHDQNTIDAITKRNQAFDRKVEDRITTKRNELYDEVSRNPDGTYVTVTTSQSKKYIENILKSEKGNEIRLGFGEDKPTVKNYEDFLGLTQQQYLSTMRNTDDALFDDLVTGIEETYSIQREAFVARQAKGGTDPDTAINLFNSESRYNTFKNYLNSEETDSRDLAKFIYDRFINPKKNMQRMGGALTSRAKTKIKNIAEDPDYNSSNIRLIDILNIKRRYAKIANKPSEAVSPTAKKEAQNVNELMDLFLSEMSNDTTLSDYARKKANADTFFKAYDLPLRTKKIMNNRRLRKHYDSKYAAQSQLATDGDLNKLSPEEYQDIQNMVDIDNVEGYDIIRSLFDPNVINDLRKQGVIDTRDPFLILKSFRDNLDPEDIPNFKDSIMRSLVKGIDEGNDPTKRNGALNLTSSIDENFINKLKQGDYITNEHFKELEPFVKLRKQLRETTNNSLEESFNRTSANLDFFVNKNKDSVAGSFLNQIINQRDRTKTAEDAAEDIADLIVKIGTQNNRIGVRTFFRPMNDEDAKLLNNFDKYVFEGMDYDEAESFRKFMRGESIAGDTPFSDIETRKVSGVEENPFDRLLTEFEGREGGDKVIDGLSKIFTEAALSKGFKRTDSQSQLGSRIAFGMSGKKFSSGAVHELNAQGLTDAISEYKPFFKAILRKKVEAGKAGDADKYKNIMQELDDITEITKSVNFKIGEGEQIQGMPSPFSIESIISRVYGVVRGVVSARYVFSEWGIRQMRQGQAEVMRSFLTDPASVHVLHDVFVKGKTTPVYMNSLYNRIFSAPSMALLFQRLDNDTKTADADEVIEASLAQIAGEELTQQEKMLQQAWFG